MDANRLAACVATAFGHGPGPRRSGFDVRGVALADALPRDLATRASGDPGGPPAFVHPRARGFRSAAADWNSGRDRDGYNRALSVDPYRVCPTLRRGKRLRSIADGRGRAAAFPLLSRHEGDFEVRDYYRQGLSALAHRPRSMETSVRVVGADRPRLASRSTAAHALGLVPADLCQAGPRGRRPHVAR